MKKIICIMVVYKYVVFVVYDNCKGELLCWVIENKEKL